MSKEIKRLVNFFHRHRVLDMKTLIKSTNRSRRSLFRDLSELKYLSSYTHAGRYYTLPGIPLFNENGLWFFQGVGFTQKKTLKAALTDIVNRSANGFTHRELQAIFHIRVHNTLLELIREHQIGRETYKKEYLYVNRDPKQSIKQVVVRREHISTMADAKKDISDEIVIEVLIELIHSSNITIDINTVIERLCKRGIVLSKQQVKRIYNKYGLNTEKKIPP